MRQECLHDLLDGIHVSPVVLWPLHVRMIALVECTRCPTTEGPIDRKDIKMDLPLWALMADYPEVASPLVLVALEGVPSPRLLIFLSVWRSLDHFLFLMLGLGVFLPFMVC